MPETTTAQLSCDLNIVDTCDRCGVTKELTGGYAPAGLICEDCSRHLHAIDLFRSHGLLHRQDNHYWYITWCMSTDEEPPPPYTPDYDTRYEEAEQFIAYQWFLDSVRSNDAGGFGYPLD